MTVSPRDDLFRHVNGEWLATHEIPADRGRDGAFMALRDQAELDVRAIVEDCANGTLTGPNADKIGAVFASFMDEESIEAAGATPLAEDAQAIRGAVDHEDLARVMGALEVTGAGSAFDWEVSNDVNEPTRYTMFIYQGGLGLPDEAYYREDAHAETRVKYVETLGTLLRLAGLSEDPEGDSAKIMELETALAAEHWDAVTTRDAIKTNNPMSYDEFREFVGDFPLDAWAEGTGQRAAFERLNVMTPPYFEALGRIWPDTDLDTLKSWLLAHLVIARGPYLSSDIVQARFDFYGTVLTGATEIKDRWKRALVLVDSALDEAVGELYVSRHFPPAAKERMDALVANLLAAYRESITALDWMGEETKVEALKKLDTFLPKIGYPNKWRDYSALEVSSDDLLGNVRAIIAHNVAYEVNKLAGPVDRDEWLMPPHMVNAYYMPPTNEIAFPAAILQPPFFDLEADDATNFGGIGAVIGHEIGHGFDDQGAQYDATGQLRSWWTDEDREAFEARTKALIGQYDVLTPQQLEGTEHHVNGGLTIGENIGDLGGLSISLKALAIALAERGSSLADEPEIDGATALQRYFLNWSLVWREKSRREDQIRLLTIDPHSPAEFRCNQTAKNVPEFHEAFGVTEGDGMWLAPEDRVKIW
ncbi:endothelin-converting enzyme . Metallo peptidase. MEROPS family M13 [Ruaniaceae bacterium KH17]|nr:endothelin-converting enzyme . Metallo peptidase. MEROPS family M13 [Ruaniaceae bacterium KH17]